MSDVHSHRCGTEPRSGRARTGCGHVWEHDGDALGDPGDESFDKAHFCPACGRGPWTYRVQDESVDESAKKLLGLLNELLSGRMRV